MCDSEELLKRAGNLFELIKLFDIDEKVYLINSMKEMLHDLSPFCDEPVDFVKWVPADEIQANDYNPNEVAPPEMALLALSILSDGYTQPIVSWDNGSNIEVVDGFHRNRVGKENPEVKDRIHGYLPIVQIKADRTGENDRIAATIRHNRARGKHQITAMSDIVIDLKRRNWSPKKIGTELGMDPDEVLRLCQITGLREMFSDSEFSEAWKVGEDLSPVLEMGGDEQSNVAGSEEQGGHA